MENWKVIKGYDNYQISDLGKIKNIKTGKELTPIVHKKRKYLKINLFNQGKISTFDIHRLVAETFIENPNGLKTVDHIDRNKLNNSVTNLRWTTLSDNQRNKLYSKPVITYCEHTKQYVLYDNIRSINRNFENIYDAANEFIKLI